MVDLQYLAADWPAISRRLDEALALAPAERNTWLDALNEGDGVKAKLRQLLGDAGDVETGDFLGTLPKLAFGRAAAAGGDGVAAGGTIGPYRLLAELGHGGMGTVWLAERVDGQPRRKIALKLPHVGWAPGLAARLARERDILASLEHPNIARLYDAGVDPLGRPYLALEYVDGTPIDRHCAAHSLSLRERLALLLQVAAAVAHAHTRLVVHRDLKPSNILVTGGGGVRLLDFGIAKMLQEEGGAATDLTAATGRVLTPDYASPEQIRGETIGTASDVYSLGVVTYELLAQVRPYHLAGSGAVGLVEAIAEAEPPPASRVALDAAAKRQLKGDLDAILNKVLKKSTVERYPTIEAFAADIERHLRGEPVQARPNAPWYHAERWVRRHKLETAVAVAILVAVPAGAVAQAAVLTALAAGAGVALWQARVARRQADRARTEAARAEQVKDFALSIFESADTDAGAGAETTAADLLKAAQVRVESEFAGRPQVATELMTAIGYSLLGQGKLDEAGDVLCKAIALGNRELGPRHRRTLAATVVYGEALVGLGRSKEAIQLLTAAATEARRQGAGHELIDALRWLGSAQIDAGDVAAGIASSEQAVEVLTSPLGAGVSKLDASAAWASLANALVSGNRAGQVEAARRALALAKEIYGGKLTEPVINDRILLATALAREGQAAAAIAELSTVLADTSRTLGPEHPKVVFAAYFLGNARLEAGDVVGAVEAFRTSLGAAERSKLRGSFGLAMSHFHLGRALAAARLDEEALPHFEAAASYFRDAGGPEAPLALRSLSSRAFVLARLGQLDAADREFDALTRVQSAGPCKAETAIRLALLRSLQHRHDEATALARSGVDGLRANPAKNGLTSADADSALGAVLLAGGHPAEAIAPLQRAVHVYAQKQVMMSPDQADAITALARARAYHSAHGGADRSADHG